MGSFQHPRRTAFLSPPHPPLITSSEAGSSRNTAPVQLMPPVVGTIGPRFNCFRQPRCLHLCYLIEHSFKSKALIKYQQYVSKYLSSQSYLILCRHFAPVYTGYSKHFIRNTKIFEKISFTNTVLLNIIFYPCTTFMPFFNQ